MTKYRMELEVTTVLETRNRGTLENAKYLLDRAGIRYVVEGESVHDPAKPYRLRVPAEDGEKARELFHNIQFLLDFEKGVGTYLKVIRFSQTTNPDGYAVLYLRPGERFLFAGYWAYYEWSVAAGHWTRRDREIRLVGQGTVQTDSLSDNFDKKPFERIFMVEDMVHTPALISSEALEDWSLLGWRGNYSYVGTSTIIDPDGRWLPKSLSVVDEWIEGLLKT